MKLVYVCLIFLLSACSHNNSSTTNNDSGNLNGQGSGALSGTYVGPCQGNGTNSQGSSQSTAQVSDTQMAFVSKSFAANACSGTTLMQVQANFSYVISGVSAQDATITNLDVTESSISITPLDPSFVSYFNTSSYCGYSDWALGVAKDVDNNSCMSGFKPGTVMYTSAKIGNNQIQWAQPDSTNNGTTPNLRETAISPDVYTKQ